MPRSARLQGKNGYFEKARVPLSGPRSARAQVLPSPLHSCRSACTGSMRTARRAGYHAARVDGKRALLAAIRKRKAELEQFRADPDSLPPATKQALLKVIRERKLDQVPLTHMRFALAHLDVPDEVKAEIRQALANHEAARQRRQQEHI